MLLMHIAAIWSKSRQVQHASHFSTFHPHFHDNIATHSPETMGATDLQATPKSTIGLCTQPRRRRQILSLECKYIKLDPGLSSHLNISRLAVGPKPLLSAHDQSATSVGNNNMVRPCTPFKNNESSLLTTTGCPARAMPQGPIAERANELLMRCKCTRAQAGYERSRHHPWQHAPCTALTKHEDEVIAPEARADS